MDCNSEINVFECVFVGSFVTDIVVAQSYNDEMVKW